MNLTWFASNRKAINPGAVGLAFTMITDFNSLAFSLTLIAVCPAVYTAYRIPGSGAITGLVCQADRTTFPCGNNRFLACWALYFFAHHIFATILAALAFISHLNTLAFGLALIFVTLVVNATNRGINHRADTILS